MDRRIEVTLSGYLPTPTMSQISGTIGRNNATGEGEGGSVLEDGGGREVSTQSHFYPSIHICCCPFIPTLSYYSQSISAAALSAPQLGRLQSYLHYHNWLVRLPADVTEVLCILDALGSGR